MGEIWPGFLVRSQQMNESASGINHRIYHKAFYREYTDATFKTLKIRSQQWAHMGILGPLIRAEVGDSIQICLPK